GTPVLKQRGAVVFCAPNSAVMSTPPSKKSGDTSWLVPIPSVASAESHGVVTVFLYGRVVTFALPEALVVEQSESAFGRVGSLQSPPIPLSSPLQPPSTLGLKWPGRESMQPPSPKKGEFGSVDARHTKALTLLTPPPFENSETTRTSLFVCCPVKFL